MILAMIIGQEKGQTSNIQAVVDCLSKQKRLSTQRKQVQRIRVCFAKKQPTNDPVEVNGKPLEVVSSAKILGLNVSNDLKWNVHISELVKKASSRLYCLKQLKRSRVNWPGRTYSILLYVYQVHFGICQPSFPPCSASLSE